METDKIPSVKDFNFNLELDPKINYTSLYEIYYFYDNLTHILDSDVLYVMVLESLDGPVYEILWQKLEKRINDCFDNFYINYCKLKFIEQLTVFIKTFEYLMNICRIKQNKPLVEIIPGN